MMWSSSLFLVLVACPLVVSETVSHLNYSNNENWQMPLACSSSDDTISIYFTTLSLETSYDILRIRHVLTSLEYFNSRESSNAQGTTLAIPTSHVIASFTSDSTVTHLGFQFDWTCVGSGSSDGGSDGGGDSSDDLTTPGSVITHFNYENSERFSWVLSCPYNADITVSFSELNLEFVFDFVRINDSSGREVFDSDQFRGTAPTLPLVVPLEDNYVSVTFTSDSSITDRGFQFAWTCDSNAYPSGADLPPTLTTYDSNDGNLDHVVTTSNLDTHWHKMLQCRSTQSVEVSFDSFTVHSPGLVRVTNAVTNTDLYDVSIDEFGSRNTGTPIVTLEFLPPSPQTTNEGFQIDWKCASSDDDDGGVVALIVGLILLVLLIGACVACCCCCCQQQQRRQQEQAQQMSAITSNNYTPSPLDQAATAVAVPALANNSTGYAEPIAVQATYAPSAPSAPSDSAIMTGVVTSGSGSGFDELMAKLDKESSEFSRQEVVRQNLSSVRELSLEQAKTILGKFEMSMTQRDVLKQLQPRFSSADFSQLIDAVCKSDFDKSMIKSELGL